MSDFVSLRLLQSSDLTSKLLVSSSSPVYKISYSILNLSLIDQYLNQLGQVDYN